jgi:hypothetical protein
MIWRSSYLRFKESERTGSSTRLDDTDRWKRIRCPKCVWRPARHDRWLCSCGHTWNTFDTRGVCPACSYAWRDTMCPRCQQWSPHVAWYAED